MTSKDQSSDAHPYVEASPFYRVFSTPTRAKLVDVFLRNPHRELTASDLTELADVDQSAISRNINALIESGIVEYLGYKSDGKHYRLDTENEFAKALGRAHAEVITEDIPLDEESSADDKDETLREDASESPAKAAEDVKKSVPNLKTES